MKCNDVLQAYAAGGVLARFRAQRHAVRCEACAAELVQFERAREELSRAPEMTETYRAVWMQAAIQRASDSGPAVVPLRAAKQLRWSPAGVALLTLATGAVIFSFYARQPATDVALIEHENESPAQAGQRVEFPRLKQMNQSLDELSRELKQLERQAELLDARRDLERLSAIYQPLGPTHTSQTITN